MTDTHGTDKQGTGKPDETAPKAGYVPKPPSPAELDQVSRDQALITDEWADADPPAPDAAAKD